MLKDLLEQIKPSLEQLPGKAAHEKLMPGSRKMFKLDTSKLRESSVLITLFQGENDVCFFLTKRPDYPGHHSGQMCIPGGKKEGMESSVQTALRENHEEIGLLLPQENVFGRLSSIAIPISNFSIVPFIGYVDYPFKLNTDPTEVENTFVVPISELKSAPILKSTKIINDPTAQIPYFELQGQIVWGATAMILSEFKTVLGR